MAAPLPVPTFGLVAVAGEVTCPGSPMDHQGTGGCGRGHGRGEMAEQHFGGGGEGFLGGNLGFGPGYEGAYKVCGRSWHHGGPRQRGAHFVPHRGGFTGRPCRGGCSGHQEEPLATTMVGKMANSDDVTAAGQFLDDLESRPGHRLARHCLDREPGARRLLLRRRLLGAGSPFSRWPGSWGLRLPSRR